MRVPSFVRSSVVCFPLAAPFHRPSPCLRVGVVVDVMRQLHDSTISTRFAHHTPHPTSGSIPSARTGATTRHQLLQSRAAPRLPLPSQCLYHNCIVPDCITQHNSIPFTIELQLRMCRSNGEARRRLQLWLVAVERLQMGMKSNSIWPCKHTYTRNCTCDRY
jgi:hypothetical protein